MAARYFDSLAFTLERNVVSLYAQVTFGIAEVDQITFAAKASTTNGDYFVINDWKGGSWAVGLDTLGTGAATPTGAAWLAVPAANKVYTDISSATTGTDVEVLVATAINALVGFTTVITTANSTTHMNATNTGAGVVVAPSVYSRAGAAGTGSVTKSVTTAGTANGLVTAAAALPAGNSLANVGGSPSKGWLSMTQTATGIYKFVLGGPQVSQLDNYHHVLDVAVLWDTTQNSGTAPLAPLYSLNVGSIRVGATFSLEFTNATGTNVATNPAGGEQCFLELLVANSNTY